MTRDLLRLWLTDAAKNRRIRKGAARSAAEGCVPGTYRTAIETLAATHAAPADVYEEALRRHEEAMRQ